VRAFDALAYIFLTVKELEPMAAGAGDTDRVERLRSARIAAAAALARMGHSGGR
jgi:hypothetical protein